MAKIAISGAVAERPGRPGHAWVFLSWLLGLQALGHEVLFIDRLARAADGRVRSRSEAAASPQWRWLARAMRVAGLEGRYAALLDGGSDTLGLSRRRLARELAGASALVNFNGYLDDQDLLAAASTRVYLDIDPGFAQMWEAEGLADTFAGHDAFVTLGTRVGSRRCSVPTAGRRWVGTLPPVLIERWRPARARALGAFTSVCSWRGPFAPVEHGGVRYGLRAHQFRRFLDLPARVDAPFELALDIDGSDRADLAALRAGRWRLLDPRQHLGGFASYARFLRGSMAEFAVAKGLYVDSRGGWFSDRSATYLACGKPVVAQDTGFGEALPVGRGLLAFDDPAGAQAALEEVRGGLREHSAAAREIAREHLASEVVLGRLIEELALA